MAMPRNQFNRDMDRYRNESFDREYDRNFDRSNYNSRTSLDQGRVNMGENEDYGRSRDYERDFGESSRDYGWDKRFDRSRRDYDRDFMRGRERDSDRGWFGGDMRQNDFGTRRMSDDNFRSTRWGADRNLERREFGRSDRGEHYGKGPKGWKRSDERIREEACEALWRDNEIDASEIDVQVKDGTLTLSGSVASRDLKRAAEHCVEDISGVDDVHNELRVKREGGILSSLRGGTEKDQKSQSRSNLS